MRPSVSHWLAAALAALVAGCGSFGSSDEKLSALPEFTPSVTLDVAWRSTLKGSGLYPLAPARVGRDAVIVAGADGVVERRDGASQGWRVALGTPLAAGVGSDGVLAVVVTLSGEAIALDAASGAERWRAKVGAEVLAAPSVTERTVAIRASDSRIFGFSAQDGKRLWVYQRPTPPLALRSHGGLLTQDEVGVAGFPGGKMVALSLANGGALWELTVALPKGTTEIERIADVVGTPVLFERQICAAAFQGRTACFNLANGDLLWARDISSATGVARDATQVYLTDEQGGVVALDASTGASVWRQDKLAGRKPGRPLPLGATVAVADAGGYVHLLRREDGALVGRQATDGGPLAVDLVRADDDRFVAQTVSGGVFGFALR